MSCNCNHTGGQQHFPCICDSFVHPAKLNIGMGLSDIPRQIAGFPEFRKAMLYSIRPRLLDPFAPDKKEDPADIHKHALDLWKAQKSGDPGIMLLEMWAYICDSLSFYDKVIAQEEYLRTAMRRPSLRKLVALLGYLPRPAIGSSVYLTALGEGRLKIKLPRGTAFRSDAFDGNPAQVFELDDEKYIHPLTGKWNVKAPQADIVTVSGPKQLLVLPQINLKAGVPFLLLDADVNNKTQGLWVNTISPYTGNDGKIYNKIALLEPAKLTKGYSLKKLTFHMPLQSTGLWTVALKGAPLSIDKGNNYLVLDSLQRGIKTGQYILVSRYTTVRWFRVTNVEETIRQQTGTEKVIINNSTFDIPGRSVPVTLLTLDQPLNSKSRKAPGDIEWHDSNKSELIVHFSLQQAGAIVNEPGTFLFSNNPILFKEKAEQPPDQFVPTRFFLTDKNARAVKVNAQLNYVTSGLNLAGAQSWQPGLEMPVTAFGNVLKASRGETVPMEILGSGDATIINQTFKLKKKPLTYFPAPTVADDRGLKNTLLVYVNGLRWAEVPTFFNRKEDEEIYIVRQNDDGDSFITFGDGLRGRRLPTGSDNIRATYRYGAEQAAPPAGTITQIAKPVLGFSTVNNPQAASGGDDAEEAEGLRTHAPKSILTLGRIVSIQDIEAVALTVPGVRAVQVEWRWQHEKQCPLVHIWYIGEEGIGQALNTKLMSMADPSIIIHVEKAQGVVTHLVMDIELNPRYVAEDVLKEAKLAFMAPQTGLLVPERAGIGKPLFRSVLFATAREVSGVLSVNNITWNGGTFSVFAKPPGAGKYFDFENGSFLLTINE